MEVWVLSLGCDLVVRHDLTTAVTKKPALHCARSLLAGLLAGCGFLVSCGGSDASNARIDPFVVAADVVLVQAPRVAEARGDTWLAWAEQGASAPRAVAARVGASGRTHLTVLTAAATGPVQLATTSRGTPMAIWHEEAPSGRSRMVVAHWGGLEWVREQAIEDSIYEEQLIVGSAGQVALAWNEFTGAAGSRFRVAIRAASGSWGAPRDVRVIGGTLPGRARLAFNEAGDLFAAWLEYVNNGASTSDPDFALWHSILTPGGAWSSPGRIEPEKVRDMRVATISARSWLVAWSAGGSLEPGGLYSKRLIDGVWDGVGRRIDLNGTEEPRSLDLQSSNGVVQAAWRAQASSTGPYEVRVARMDLADGRWPESTLLFESPVVQPAELRLVQRADGRAALIWNYFTGDHVPWVAVSPIAGLWQSANHLDDEAFDAQGADLATSQSGWTAAWYRRRGAVFDIVMRHLF